MQQSEYTAIILSENACFPWGMAASARVKNLAKGLMANNCSVTYVGLCGAVTDTPGRKQAHGIIDGIRYIYPGGFAKRSANWWLRRIDDISGRFFGVLYILYCIVFAHLDFMIIYSRNHKIVSFLARFLHIFHIKVILEICEWPLAIAQTKNNTLERAEKFCFNTIPLVDAVLPISLYIDREIRQIAKSVGKNIPSFRIPILVDIDMALEIKDIKGADNAPYLIYCGSIAYMDIAMVVVDTMVELKKMGIILEIKFTGGGLESNFAHIKKYVELKGMLNQFTFTGFLEEEELFRLMAGATGQLAPLPENLQSQARFPTKIGYYLASGSPVVTNNFGEVTTFLQDGYNAFIANNCTPKEFARKITFLLTNREISNKVGMRGRKTAAEKFHYTSACKGLDDFLAEILSN